MYWTLHTKGGPRRVNHAAARVGDKIYSFGGFCSLEDYRLWEPITIHVLDATVFKWSPIDYSKLLQTPFQRYGHTCVPHGDKIYLWGGRNDSACCEIVFCFDTVKLEWTIPAVTGSIPRGKDGHSACIINDKMYIFGGFDYFSDEYTNDLHCLDLRTMEWNFVESKGEKPIGRDFHSALAYGDRMYIFGGRSLYCRPEANHDYYCNRMYYFDTITDTWVTLDTSGITPVGRRSHSSWIHNDFLFVFGGYNQTLQTHYNDIHRFSLQGNNWELINVYGTPPCERRRQVCILYDNKIYLFGGTSPVRHIAEEREHHGNVNEDESVQDKDDLHILDFLPSLKVSCLMYVLKHKMDTSGLPRDLLFDIKIMTQPNKISVPIVLPESP